MWHIAHELRLGVSELHIDRYGILVKIMYFTDNVAVVIIFIIVDFIHSFDITFYYYQCCNIYTYVEDVCRSFMLDNCQ